MAAQLFTFEKAVKHAAKARVALIGPSGSGKSYTSLVLARELAGPDGKIAAVDTEHGTLEKYADLFDFYHVKLSSFTADNFFGTLQAAEDAGFSVINYDSLSHFWMGKDGALEYVDERTKFARSKGADQMSGWKDWTPTERAMIDAILKSPLHVIVTMRTKTEYREVKYMKDGVERTKREKVGLMPVQRQGLEYEFDLIGYLDDENTFITDKTRCPHYSQKAISTPTGKDFTAFKRWLDGPEVEPLISDEQRKRLYTIATNGKVAKPAVMEVLARYRYASSTEIKLKDYDAIVREIEKLALATLPVADAPAAKPRATSSFDIKAAREEISEFEDAIGHEAFMRLLGGEGFTKVADITSQKEATRMKGILELAVKVEQQHSTFTATDDDLPPVFAGQQEAS